MKAALSSRPFTRAVLNLSVGVMLGLLTVSIGLSVADALEGDSIRTEYLKVTK